MAGYAENKVAQIDREVAAHQAEIKRLKARRGEYSKLAAQDPAEPTPESTADPDQSSQGVND